MSTLSSTSSNGRICYEFKADFIAELTTSLLPIGKIAWLRLDPQTANFTIIPETGAQVWAVLQIETIFDEYHVQSAANDVINMELPLDTLQRALKSCQSASDAVIKLTKRQSDKLPILMLTVTTASSRAHLGLGAVAGSTLVTQEIPVKILAPTMVEGITQPICPEPDVHIFLPPLNQLRAFSERFAKINGDGKWILAANLRGEFSMSAHTDAVKIESVWRGLTVPELNPAMIEGNIEDHPSVRRSRDEWAAVRIDGKDWVRLLKVSLLAKRVVACEYQSDKDACMIFADGIRFLREPCSHTICLSDG